MVSERVCGVIRTEDVNFRRGRVRGELTQPRRQGSSIIRRGLCEQAIDWDRAHFLMMC